MLPLTLPKFALPKILSKIRLPQDARDYQILFLSLFLILGVSTRDWTLHPDLMLLVFGVCWLTQAVAVVFTQAIAPKSMPQEQLGKFPLNIPNPTYFSHLQNLGSLRSATITALGLCLLLRSDSYVTMAVAAFLAIISKFIFRLNGKHWFNPANFGIVAALSLGEHAWVSPGQWGDDSWYALLFLGLGALILKRVGRWDTSITFLGAYALLEGVRNLWLGWTFDVLAHRLMSGSLLLFALFMVTDPRSIPNARIGRIVWAVAIAVLTFVLRNQFYIADAMFYALFALSPLTLLCDRIWSGSKFSWSPRLPELAIARS
ncbi:RnfABCDGE type electron transport complex subunit D [Tumidithrix elongata RA019]|uniref:RnfABCDGE type electron transport complex subunit D n=1 Tax=Tumidithrix elongata BACA0141 TaxID=2716417 RepID=A0AAW9Q295_9CYAN|nr:RnfABCDGE type electron transport complex subunit D [Tumidithrix elongata RA019]